MPIRRASDYRRSRWKNGGGETAEIVVAPPGAGLETFDWRISMASVATDGPFSVFPGVDRTLSILDGSGIRLQVGDEPARLLDVASAPFAFSGDASASATLVDGPVTDFNVMTRRSGFGHTVRRFEFAAGDTLTPDVSATVVFCDDGGLECVSGAESSRLEPRDVLVLGAAEEGRWRLRAVRPATIYIVTIAPSRS